MPKFDKIRRKCLECGQEFIVKFGKIKKNEKQYTSQLVEKEVIIDDEAFKLTWYDCPFCSKRHIVQVDNNETMETLKKIREMLEHEIKHASDKDKSGRRAVFNKLKSDLADTRRRLESELDGKAVLDDIHGEHYLLEFYHE